MAQVVSGIAQVMPPSQSGSSMMDVAEHLFQMNEAKKQASAKEFDMLLKARDAGLPVSPGKMMKAAKGAGIEIANPKELEAMVGAHRAQGQASQGTAPGSGTTPTPTPGGGISQMPNPTRGAVQNPTAAVAGGIKNKKQAAEAVFQRFIQQGLQMAQARGESEARQQEIVKTAQEIKLKAGRGEMTVHEATGRLMAMVEMPFNAEGAKLSEMTDEQRKGVFDMAAGAMTVKDHEERRAHIADTLQTTQRITDPEMAQKAARILEEGGTLPPEIRAVMKPYTLSEMASQASTARELADLGVPGNRIGEVMQRANVVGVGAALPKGMQTAVESTRAYQQATLGIEGKRLQIEQQRANAEYAHYALELENAAAKSKSQDKKDALENFKALLDISKANKGKISQDVIDGATAKIAENFGLRKESVRGFWDYVTGAVTLGTNFPKSQSRFVPNVADADRGTIRTGMGAPQVGGQPSTDARSGTPQSAETPKFASAQEAVESIRTLSPQEARPVEEAMKTARERLKGGAMPAVVQQWLNGVINDAYQRARESAAGRQQDIDQDREQQDAQDQARKALTTFMGAQSRGRR